MRSEIWSDPMAAWEPWSPSETEPWDHQRIRLLYRRAGFGATEQQIREAMKRSPQEIVSELVSNGSQIDPSSAFEKESATLASSVRASGDMSKLASWWLHRMLNTPTPIVEKMTLFWHGHFATGAEKVLDLDLIYQQNQLLRQHCLGDFRKMVHEISKDPAMLIYLDSVTNRKAHANENYARELMELFCLGEGNYSETDVQELSKCFTGWEIRRKQFRFNAYQHDDSEKTILGKGPVKSGEEAIDVVLASDAMPRFVAYKLFQFLLCDEPAPTPELIQPLADRFAESQFQIGPVVEMILGSRLMLSGWSIGKRIRSPIELVMDLMRSLGMTTNLTKLPDRLKGLGQSLFYPPNVKGWLGGRTWINSSTLIGRANLIYDLLNDANTKIEGKSIDQWGSSIASDDVAQLVDRLGNGLFASLPTSSERLSILGRLEQTPKGSLAKQAIIELASLPRIHMS
ncbi:DUF1800 domain-containing protein [Pirellulaceae bacterium SH449]